MSDDNETGWIYLNGQVVGNTEDGFTTAYNWDGVFYPEKADAIRDALTNLGHDDFNVAHLVGGVMDWFGWMHEQHPAEDTAEVAEQFGWTAAPAVVGEATHD